MKPFRPAVLTLLVLLACLPACSRKDKVIPRDKMVDIYADLFVADQWIREQGSAFMDADTVRFYEPIFRKYGYTTLDFRNSANYYLQDARRYARILQRVSSRLGDHAKYLEQLSSDIYAVEAEIGRLMRSAAVPPVFYDSAFFARAAGFELELSPDERGAWMPVVRPEAQDSAAVADTLLIRDSLQVRDSLQIRDTLRTEDPLLPKKMKLDPKRLPS